MIDIHFDGNRIIAGFSGDKCYSVYRGMYNCSGNVYDRDFTNRDIQYLRKFLKDNIQDYSQSITLDKS